jgi:hypothetical protein
MFGLENVFGNDTEDVYMTDVRRTDVRMTEASDVRMTDENKNNPNFFVTTKEILEYFKNTPTEKNNTELKSQNSTQLEYINDELLAECKNNNIYNFNYKKISELYDSGFYNYDFMHCIQCLLNGLLKGNNFISSNVLIRKYFTHLRRIGAQSAVGNVYSTFFDESDVNIFAIKTNSDISANDYQLVHETFAGLILNKLRKKIPNFAYTFGLFQCGPILDPTTHIFTFCSTKDDKSKYLIEENITSSITLSDFITNGCTSMQYLQIYLQILYALDIALEKYDYTHYDLHDTNV